MKTKFIKELRSLYLVFPDEYKEKIEHIVKIPFIQQGIDVYSSVLNMLVKDNQNILPNIESYYSSIYSLLLNIHENMTGIDFQRHDFMKMFINDVIPILETYYKILKDVSLYPLRKDAFPPITRILDYMMNIYSNFGKDIYKEVVEDVYYFVSNIDSLLEFYVIVYYPFLCSVDKPYYGQCMNVYINKIFYREQNIVMLIERLCQKYLEKGKLRDEIINIMRKFKQLYAKTKYRKNLRDVACDFISYLYINIYNNIFNNINVEDLFKILKCSGYFGAFRFVNREEMYWYLNPEILDIFMRTIIDIDKNNSNILEKMSSVDSSISDTVCNILLYDVIVDEIRKNGKDNVLLELHDHLEFMEQYINVFSKYEYIPSFLKAFIYKLNYRSIFNSIRLYLNSETKHIYNYNLCNIYLNNPKLLYNIIISKKFYEMYYKPISYSSCKRNPEYSFKYWIMFGNFMGYMEIIEYRNRNIRFEDFIVSYDVWYESCEYILEHFLLTVCFVILPILVEKNNKNNTEYINKVLNNIIRMAFEGRIKPKSNSINVYIFEFIESNKKISEKFGLMSLYRSRREKRIIGCIIFMCLLYYFGIDIISDYDLQNKIKAVFDKIDGKTSKNIFDILYILYDNLTNNKLKEIIDLSANMYGLV